MTGGEEGGGEPDRTTSTNSREGGPGVKAWYVAVAAYRGEAAVVRELQAKGFDAYAPMETVWRHTPRTKIAVQRPLLPRYVFVRMDPSSECPDVRHTDGVVGLVSRGGSPLCLTPADDGLVGAIRVREAEGAYDHTAGQRHKKPFLKGDKVRIVGGQFAGFLAEFERATSNSKRAIVLLSVFGRAGPTELNVDHLAAA